MNIYKYKISHTRSAYGFGEIANPSRKLIKDIPFYKITRRIKEGMSIENIGKLYGISVSSINNGLKLFFEEIKNQAAENEVKKATELLPRIDEVEEFLDVYFIEKKQKNKWLLSSHHVVLILKEIRNHLKN